MNRSSISLLLLCTLLVGCQGYKKENGRWVWVDWDETVGTSVHPVENADVASFHRLSDPQYGADKIAVYRHQNRITNANPASFRRIGRSLYSRDAKRVFFVDAEIPGADPATFKPLAKYPWARDKEDVYAGTNALHVRDISTFELLQGFWAKDSKAFYAINNRLVCKTVPCDYESFVTLNGSYAKDKNRGYCQTEPLEGSDAPSFVAIGETLAKDKHRTYSRDNFILR